MKLRGRLFRDPYTGVAQFIHHPWAVVLNSLDQNTCYQVCLVLLENVEQRSGVVHGKDSHSNHLYKIH